MSGELTGVPVTGGQLAVGRWGTTGPYVLAAHGITSSHRAWTPLGEQLAADHRLLAVDLRGRGRSAGLPGPYGMVAHADDLLRVLDSAGAERAVVVGHSMGGFVAVVLAHRHPDRVSRLVLVDGGLPLPSGPLDDDGDVDAALDALIGPAFARLSMTFPTTGAYRSYWRRHPALAASWGPSVEQYVDYDLGGTEPRLRPLAVKEAVRADAADLLTGSALPAGLAALAHPTTFLRAERGMLDEERALYADETVREWTRRLRTVTARTVPGVNHYTITLSAAGAAAVAAAVRTG